MSNYRKKFGRLGEQAAERYLKNKGYQILERNFKIKYAEIDLICQYNNEIIFIEVKTRGTDYSFGENAVDSEKINKIDLASEIYLDQNEDKQKLWPRIDILVVEVFEGEEIKLIHYEAVEV